jgi:hypothetical protein
MRPEVSKKPRTRSTKSNSQGEREFAIANLNRDSNLLLNHLGRGGLVGAEEKRSLPAVKDLSFRRWGKT